MHFSESAGGLWKCRVEVINLCPARQRHVQPIGRTDDDANLRFRRWSRLVEGVLMFDGVLLVREGRTLLQERRVIDKNNVQKSSLEALPST